MNESRSQICDDWWREFKDKPAIKKAIRKSLAVHISEVIANRLNHKSREGYTPKNWQQLANDLRIARTDIYRKKTGNTAFLYDDDLGVAALLGITPADLRPHSLEDWLEGVVIQLMRTQTFEPDTQAISLFVLYCLNRVRLWETVTGQNRREPAPLKLEEQLLLQTAAKLELANQLDDLRPKFAQIEQSIASAGGTA